MRLETRIDSSQAVVERIEHFIQSQTNGMIRDLIVDVVGESVVISGRTKTYYTKQLATHAVLSTVSDLIASDGNAVVLTNDIEVC